jgi:diguanylate cyclase (GGDEF)-like protein
MRSEFEVIADNIMGPPRVSAVTMLRTLTPHDLLKRLLDERVDAAALDGLKTLLPRIVIVAMASLLVYAHMGYRPAAIWISFVGLCELWCWQCSVVLLRYDVRHLQMRLSYAVSALATTIAWTSLPVLLWWGRVPDIGAAAVVMLISQLIHAQAFAFRAPLIMAFKVGSPACALLTLPWLVETTSYLSTLTSIMASGLCIGYIVASVKANLRSEASLRKAHEELEYLAYFDALTSLANRRSFTLHLRDLIELSGRRQSQFALLLIDLDHFKAVNDTLGHDAGDAVLVAAGEHLRAIVRDSSYVARLGGDEFAILMPGVGDTAQIDAVCCRIADRFQHAVDFNSNQIYLSYSVGIAIYPSDGDAIQAIFKSADLALYEAKRSGRSTWCFSDPR